MTFEMIHGEIGFARTKGETFRDRRANHQRTRQARTGRRGECIDLIQCDSSISECVFEQTRRMQEMASRSHFRHDAAVRLVLRLRRNFAREQPCVPQNCDCRFVAGRFDAENGHAQL